MQNLKHFPNSFEKKLSGSLVHAARSVLDAQKGAEFVVHSLWAPGAAELSQTSFSAPSSANGILWLTNSSGYKHFHSGRS